MLPVEIKFQQALSYDFKKFSDGYKPFSITINKDDFSKPLLIGIEKTQISDLYIEKNFIHIVD